MFFGDVMNATSLELRDFPADVQDLLRDRAIRERRPIGEIIKDFVAEVAREIVEVAAPNQGPDGKEAA